MTLNWYDKTYVSLSISKVYREVNMCLVLIRVSRDEAKFTEHNNIYCIIDIPLNEITITPIETKSFYKDMYKCCCFL